MPLFKVPIPTVNKVLHVVCLQEMPLLMAIVYDDSVVWAVIHNEGVV